MRAYRPAGYIALFGPSGGTVEGETLQCVHCAYHWQIIPGSGRQRGFCLKCNGPTCGKGKCYECMPQEKWLEMMER